MFANIPRSLIQSATGLESLPRTRNVRAVQDRGVSPSPEFLEETAENVAHRELKGAKV